MSCTPSASCWRRKDSCGRPECRQRSIRYLKERRLHGPKRVPSAPIVRRLAHLHETYSLGYISTVVGIENGNLSRILRGESATIHRDLAARILAFKPDPVAAAAHRVDATGSRRRLQAMAVNGWSLQSQAERLGHSKHWTAAVSQGRIHNVAAAKATATKALFAELWDQQGPSKITRNWAARLHWAPALAWDDIDNPAAKPFIGTSSEYVHADDLEDLIRWGGTYKSIEARLGIGHDGIYHRVRNRPELLAMLHRNADGAGIRGAA